MIPPEIEDVEAYCMERQNGIDPEEFMAHYGRQGWKLSNGRPMKDWKMAIITWEKNKKRHPAAPPKQHIPTIEELERDGYSPF